jgi:hypothetical protein
MKGGESEPRLCRVEVGLKTVLKFTHCSMFLVVMPAPCELNNHKPTKKTQVRLVFRSFADMSLYLLSA